MVEQELRDAVKGFRMSGVLSPTDLHKRLSPTLAELMRLLETPGQQEAREITTQPLPTGQIPDDRRQEFSATD